MKRLILAIDLDGTVMHSRRSWSADDICIERIDGEERGFMAPEMHRALKHACKVAHIAPITSRSFEQFKRIEWDGIEISLAYVANGGMRIEPGEVEAARLYEPSQSLTVIENVMSVIVGDPRINRCRIVDGCYLLVYLNESAIDVSDMERHCGEALTMFRDRKKLYFFPIGLSKGLAVEDVRTRFPDAQVICIGDSENDIPMLELADVAVLPSRLLRSVLAGGKPPATEKCPAEVPFEKFAADSIARKTGFRLGSLEDE